LGARKTSRSAGMRGMLVIANRTARDVSGVETTPPRRVRAT
jgi:hypothetical protein